MRWQETVQSKNGVPIRLTAENEDMASIDIEGILDLAPRLLSTPFDRIWYSYDQEADVLYLNFKKPSRADDSRLSDDDVIIRYEKGEVVGITILNASKRRAGG